MEFDPQDQDIIRLLARLKNVQGEYPENVVVARRQIFLKRITEVKSGIHGGMEGGNSAENTRTPIASSATSTLLETAIIGAIIVETGAMAYFYRDKLADFVQTFTTASKVEEVTPPSVVPTSLEIQGVSPSPAIPSTAVEASPSGITETPTNTPIPAIVGDNSGVSPVVSSTPVPNGNNGHHYGQTPKPERTKENNGNNDKPPKDKDDKPPKDKDQPPEGNNDKPPEDKPPKTK